MRKMTNGIHNGFNSKVLVGITSPVLFQVNIVDKKANISVI